MEEDEYEAKVQMLINDGWNREEAEGQVKAQMLAEKYNDMK